MGYVSRYGERFHEALETDYPQLPWREPIQIMSGKVKKIGCRYCIAALGLKGSDVRCVPFAFECMEAFEAHMAAKHPRTISHVN
jgi:hypothetical protein